MSGLIWVVKPDEVEVEVSRWVESCGSFLRVESLTQFTGNKVYALTVTDFSKSDDSKVRVIFTVPHAHEPAGTAACIDVVNQLLVGDDLEGNPTDIDRAAALSSLILTFIPDANPFGRSRSPVRWWDGVEYTNEEFLNVAFGVGEDGSRFPRYGRWCSLEHKPKTLGIVYEKVWDHVYVEPNRDWSSSYYRFLIRLLPRHRYNLVLNLHQTEFERQPYNCEVILPVLQDELPEEIRRYNLSWGLSLVEALRVAGGEIRSPSLSL